MAGEGSEAGAAMPASAQLDEAGRRASSSSGNRILSGPQAERDDEMLENVTHPESPEAQHV
jgi:hypothetical protein